MKRFWLPYLLLGSSSASPSQTLEHKSDKSVELMKSALLLSGTPDHSRRKKLNDTPDAASVKLEVTSPPVKSARSPTAEGQLCVPFDTVAHDYVLQHSSYLPEPSTSGSAGDGNNYAMGQCRDSAALALREQLIRLSEPNACVASKQMTTDNVGYGFGSVVNSWIKPFAHAVDHGLSFWSPPLGSYRDGKGKRGSPRRKDDNGAPLPLQRCALDSMACWFLPLSRCETVPSLVGERRGCREGSRRGASDFEPKGRPCILKIIAENRSMQTYSLMHVKNNAEGLPNSVPVAYRHRGHFWYTSQLMSFMLQRPNAHFATTLANAKRDAGWANMQRPLLSLHVRRGDSCNPDQEASKKRRCEPLKAYMDTAVLPMAKKYGIRSIFLATDDEQTLKDLANYPQFSWHVVPGLDRGETKKHKWEANLRDGSMDNYAEAQAALVDLSLMAEGDAFVGKFTSNLDRIAFSLLVAKQQGLVPYVSLDSKWCQDWARNAGSSIYGQFFC
jgi:hypothetical protein